MVGTVEFAHGGVPSEEKITEPKQSVKWRAISSSTHLQQVPIFQIACAGLCLSAGKISKAPVGLDFETARGMKSGKHRCDGFGRRGFLCTPDGLIVYSAPRFVLRPIWAARCIYIVR